MILNGNPATQTTFNNGFVSRTATNTSTVSIFALNNSGSTNIADIQKFTNYISETVGLVENDVNRMNYATNFYLVDGESHKLGLEHFDVAVKDHEDRISAVESTSGAFDSRLDSLEPSVADHETRISDLESLNTEDVTIDTFGSTPNASGASILGQAITLQPASDVHPGGVSTVAQSFAGDKTFKDDVTIEGNLTVQGTVTTVNSATLEVTDQNILVNNGGNDASAEDAGIDVERTTTNAAIRYDSSLASKWKLGNIGALFEVIVSGVAQLISGNKTFQDKIALDIAIDSTTSGSNQSPALATSNVKFTNAGLVSIQGFSSMLNGHFACITNGTGGSVTIEHLAGTSSEQVVSPTGADFSWLPNQTLIVVRDSNSSKNRIIGVASGGGGGGISVVTSVFSKSAQTVSAGSTDKVTFGAAAVDTHAMWDNANDEAEIAAGQDGDYLLVARVAYEPVTPSGSSAVELYAYVNGSVVRVLDNFNNGFISTYRYLQGVTYLPGLVAGDLVSLYTFNNLGVSANLDSTQANAEFTLIRLR